MIAFNALQAFQLNISGYNIFATAQQAGIVNLAFIVGITTDLVAHLYRH